MESNPAEAEEIISLMDFAEDEYIILAHGR